MHYLSLVLVYLQWHHACLSLPPLSLISLPHCLLLIPLVFFSSFPMPTNSLSIRILSWPSANLLYCKLQIYTESQITGCNKLISSQLRPPHESHFWLFVYLQQNLFTQCEFCWFKYAQKQIISDWHTCVIKYQASGEMLFKETLCSAKGSFVWLRAQLVCFFWQGGPNVYCFFKNASEIGRFYKAFATPIGSCINLTLYSCILCYAYI